MREIWKPIPGYERYYEISNMGRVRSNTILIKNPRGKGSRIRKGRVLSPGTFYNFYPIVILSKNGTVKTFKIHSLMKISFIDLILGKGKEINHIDGNKNNNKIGNLERCTPSKNIKHSWDNGLRKFNYKTYFGGRWKNKVKEVVKHGKSNSTKQ